MNEPRTEEEELLEAAPSTSRSVEIVENKHVANKEPRTEEEKLLEALIEYYLEYESTMPVAPLAEQHDAELTSFYVRPPMMAYKKPNAFGQVKQSKKQEKTKISSYRELLFGDNGTYKRIYLTADAGMGKTSFSKMLARTWCQAHKPDKKFADKFSKDDLDTMRNFDFLFLIKLRQYQDTDVCCLDDMIVTMLQSKLPRGSRYIKPFVEQILCNRQCLVIVDGLDEWSHPDHTPSQALPVEVILHTTRLSGCCSVLTTTRPWKLSDAGLSSKDIDRQVEISQLDETTVRELESRAIEILNKNQRQNDQKAVNSETKSLTDFYRSVSKTIFGRIRYIPFVLLQMICLWFENNPIGKSLCEVYSNIIELTLTRWLVKTDFRHTDCKCKPSKEHENIKLKCMEKIIHCQRYLPMLLKIGELAFSTLFNVIREESLLFDEEQVLKYLSEEELKQCLDIGLLSKVKDPTSLTKVRLQLYFPHKTLQEFFCALFIATNWNNAKTVTMSIKQTISNKCKSVDDILEMSEVFVFVCGLNPEVYSDISRHLATVFSTDQSVIDHRNNVDWYSRLLVDYQRMQISCFLESTRNQHPKYKILIEDMIVGRNVLYDDMEEDEKKALKRILPDSACSMKSLTLCNLSAGEIVLIPEHAEFPCLERLSVQACELKLSQSVLTSAAHTLKYLELREVSLTDDMWSAISRLNNLHALYLYNVDVSSGSLNAVNDCICGCMSLQELRLCFRYCPSDADEKSEQRETSYNYLLRSIEKKTMLTYLRLNVAVGYQNYVLDLSKHDKLQELYLHLPLTDLRINIEQLVTCELYKMDGFSAAAVSSLMAELHGAPVLETFTLKHISHPPPRIDITALALLTKFTLAHCELRDSTVTLTLPLLTKFTLTSCDLRDSTVTLSPEMTSLETITLEMTTVNIPRYRELFLSISKLPQLITVMLKEIEMTVGEWRELLFDVIGKLPKSIHVEMQACSGPSGEEWRNIFDDMKASPALAVTSTDYEKRKRHPTATEKASALPPLAQQGDCTVYVIFKRCLGISGPEHLLNTKEEADKGQNLLEVNQEQVLAGNILPDREELNRLSKVHGRKSNVVKKICERVSLKIRESSKDILYVWPAYRYSKHLKHNQDEIIFVVITKGPLNPNSFNYDIYQRTENECGRENWIVNEKEIKEANNVDLGSLADVINLHDVDLMKAHSKLTMILARSLKSSNFGRENATIEETPCIVLYTQIKGLIPISEEPFPSSLDGIPIDVREDCFILCSGVPKAFHKHLKMSCEIGSQFRVNDYLYSSGTLGGFVDHPSHGVCGLTCAHVLFPNFVEMIPVTQTFLKWNKDGERIDVFQPSLRTNTQAGRFGRVIQAIINSSFGEENVGVDVALIKIEEREPVDGLFPLASSTQDIFTDDDPMVYSNGTILTRDCLRRGTIVYMFGAQSDIQRGFVGVRKGAAAQVQFEDSATGLSLRNLILIETPGFSKPGDSGSLVFVNCDQQLKAIGMLEGSTTCGQGFVIPISQVLQALDLLEDRLKPFC